MLTVHPQTRACRTTDDAAKLPCFSMRWSARLIKQIDSNGDGSGESTHAHFGSEKNRIHPRVPRVRRCGTRRHWSKPSLVAEGARVIRPRRQNGAERKVSVLLSFITSQKKFQRLRRRVLMAHCLTERAVPRLASLQRAGRQQTRRSRPMWLGHQWRKQFISAAATSSTWSMRTDQKVGMLQGCRRSLSCGSKGFVATMSAGCRLHEQWRDGVRGHVRADVLCWWRTARLVRRRLFPSRKISGRRISVSVSGFRGDSDYAELRWGGRV